MNCLDDYKNLLDIADTSSNSKFFLDKIKNKLLLREGSLAIDNKNLIEFSSTGEIEMTKKTIKNFIWNSSSHNNNDSLAQYTNEYVISSLDYSKFLFGVVRLNSSSSDFIYHLSEVSFDNMIVTMYGAWVDSNYELQEIAITFISTMDSYAGITTRGISNSSSTSADFQEFNGNNIATIDLYFEN